MDREELKQYLPHREPMLLVDEVEIDADGIAHAKYRIKEDEFFCRGHFPGNPVVPGVIQCEIMAQSCALLVKDEIKGKNTLYAGINNVRFKNVVRPGDLCEITAKLVDRRGQLFFCEAVLKVDGKLCCKGELSFALVEK
ncbi:MAG: 3-hydroxyacyl-ACP dehydratase FabZ [Bacteroidales bacterium]|nr:3-hydroxyacyl-ACP dehydratase FabZ [Bacteroidales bacterium]MDD5892295.1 3-hydroxyacyl-ACP dehydratase FabZ [Bacteroidales bacterium]MDY5356932.1 3-hydroxyacyl-ACP dehydratase FabZ [Candidatus Cryptobacteroides sp.]